MTEQTAPVQTAPVQTRYGYAVRYYIVDHFGEILWGGTVQIFQATPRPTDPVESATQDAVLTSKTIRHSCDKIGAPAGRILIAAATPLT